MPSFVRRWNAICTVSRCGEFSRGHSGFPHPSSRQQVHSESQMALESYEEWKPNVVPGADRDHFTIRWCSVEPRGSVPSDQRSRNIISTEAADDAPWRFVFSAPCSSRCLTVLNPGDRSPRRSLSSEAPPQGVSLETGWHPTFPRCLVQSRIRQRRLVPHTRLPRSQDIELAFLYVKTHLRASGLCPMICRTPGTWTSCARNAGSTRRATLHWLSSRIIFLRTTPIRARTCERGSAATISLLQ
jgi:hypothetical protein